MPAGYIRLIVAIMKRQVMAATPVDTIRIIMMNIVATDIVMPES